MCLVCCLLMNVDWLLFVVHCLLCVVCRFLRHSFALFVVGCCCLLCDVVVFCALVVVCGCSVFVV